MRPSEEMHRIRLSIPSQKLINKTALFNSLKRAFQLYQSIWKIHFTQFHNLLEMKKVLLASLFLVISSLGFAQQKQYVILMKESFESPLGKGRMENSNRERMEKDNSPARAQKLQKVQAFADQKGVKSIPGRQFVDAMVGFVAELTEGEALTLMESPEVEGVFPDFKMQTRPRMQGESVTGEDFYDPAIKASCAVGLMGGPQDNSGKKEVIWIVDSGIDAKHPDLNVTKSNRLATSFVLEETNPFEDLAGHGTHCAGLAAGTGRGNPGVRGMSAGAELIPVKVLDRNGEGTWSQLLMALDHIEKFGRTGDVVLMSLGEYGIQGCSDSNPALIGAIQDLASKGLFIVMSAGNDSGESSQNLPGCIEGPNIFTVGSYDFDCSGFTGFSATGNLGTPAVDFVAPGENVFSAYPGARYMVASGTSMSAALVAGLIHSLGTAPNSLRQESHQGITYSFAGR